MPSQEQIITRAMGVRVPPKSLEKELVTMEKARLPAQNHVSSPPLSAHQSRPKPASTESEDTNQVELKKSGLNEGKLKSGEGKPLESVKITAPGTYELNLPSLFERDELIMAVKEGTYFIDLKSAFKKGKKD
jgi:predicted  nucleic acid-binding Zn-ribbon protein